MSNDLTVLQDDADVHGGTYVLGDHDYDTDAELPEELESIASVGITFDTRKFVSLSPSEKSDQIVSTADDIVQKYFQLGAMLDVISNTKEYTQLGYSTFADYVLAELGFRVRKAHYLISIWKSLSNVAITESDLGDVGWTKMRAIASKITDQNKNEILNLAKTMSVSQLKEYDPNVPKSVATEPDGSFSATISLEDPETVPPVPVPEQVRTVRHTLVMHNEQEDVFMAAVNKIKKETGTDCLNECVAHMATFYLAVS